MEIYAGTDRVPPPLGCSDRRAVEHPCREQSGRRGQDLSPSAGPEGQQIDEAHTGEEKREQREVHEEGRFASGIRFDFELLRTQERSDSWLHGDSVKAPSRSEEH